MVVDRGGIGTPRSHQNSFKGRIYTPKYGVEKKELPVRSTVARLRKSGSGHRQTGNFADDLAHVLDTKQAQLAQQSTAEQRRQALGRELLQALGSDAVLFAQQMRQCPDVGFACLVETQKAQELVKSRKLGLFPTETAKKTERYLHLPVWLVATETDLSGRGLVQTWTQDEVNYNDKLVKKHEGYEQQALAVAMTGEIYHLEKDEKGEFHTDDLQFGWSRAMANEVTDIDDMLDSAELNPDTYAAFRSRWQSSLTAAAVRYLEVPQPPCSGALEPHALPRIS